MKIFGLIQEVRDRVLIAMPPRAEEETACLPLAGGLVEKPGPRINLFVPAPLTEALYRGLELVMSHHGAAPKVRSNLEIQMHSYLDSSCDETVWLKRAKYLLAYPLAKFLRNDLPPAPDVVFCPSGALRGWMRARLLPYNRRNVHLWYSWFQAKRCALPASQDIIEKTYDSHLKALTTPDTGDLRVIDEIFSNQTFVRVLDLVRDAVTANSGTPVEQGRTSLSACFEEKRANGGQHGHLRQISGLNSGLLSDDLIRMQIFDRVYIGGVLCHNHVREIRSAYGSEYWRALFRSHQPSEKTVLKATIQAVLEPMKVRVISKGEAIPYYCARPIQKAMHSCMRRMNAFRLIGRPLCPTDLIDLKVKSKPEWKWFSIDYSAATDGLSWLYSGRIFRHVISGLPRAQQELALQVLGPHDLYYPTSREHECPWIQGHSVEKRGTMSSGQLMGSILSFPILCLANLGVYLRSMWGYQVDWSDAEKLDHVLINGDDMVYAGPTNVWPLHCKVGKSVGLNMSVGKAYVHQSYLNVNSTSVVYPLDKDSTPWQINYLNAGLFFGQHKVQGKSDDDDHVSSVTSNLSTVLSGSLPGKQCELMTHLLHVHRDAIREESLMFSKSGVFSRNLFLPESVGGMGVPSPAGYKFRVSRDQRLLALSRIRSFVPDLFDRAMTPGDAAMPSLAPDILSFARPLCGYEKELVAEIRTPFCKSYRVERDAPRCPRLDQRWLKKIKIRVNEIVCGVFPIVERPFKSL